MLEDVPGLINPIIQAMVATSRGKQEQADRAQRAQQLKDEAAYKQAELKHQDAQLAEVQREHDATMDYNKQHMSILQKQLDAQLEKEGLDRLVQKMNLAKGGVDLKAAGQSDTGIPDQATQQANFLKQLQGETQAQTEGQIGAQLGPQGTALFQRGQEAAMGKEERDRLAKISEEVQHGADAEKVARIHEAAENSRANTAGIYHLKGIMLLHNLGLEDGSGTQSNKAKTLLDGIYDGTTDPDKLSKDDKQLVTNYAAANGETVPTGQIFKGYKSTLDNASAVQGILRQARDAAAKYSVDSPNATSAGNYNMRLGPLGVRTPPVGTDANGLVPGSAAHTAVEGLATTVGKFIPTLEGSARQSDQNIARQLQGLIDPKATMQMNLKNINDKVGLINQQVRAGSVGVSPDRFNLALQKRGITDIGGQNTPGAYKRIAVGPNGHQIGSNDDWTTKYDVQTGQQIQQ